LCFNAITHRSEPSPFQFGAAQEANGKLDGLVLPQVALTYSGSRESRAVCLQGNELPLRLPDLEID